MRFSVVVFLIGCGGVDPARINPELLIPDSSKDSQAAADSSVEESSVDSGLPDSMVMVDSGPADSGVVDTGWDADMSTGWGGSCAGCYWHSFPQNFCGMNTCQFVCPFSCGVPPPTNTQGPSGCTDFPYNGDLGYCCPSKNPGCK